MIRELTSRRAWLALVAGALVVSCEAGDEPRSVPDAAADEDAAAETTAASSEGGAVASGQRTADDLAIPAPSAEFETPGDSTASLADYEGTVVVLNLWGTWCPPCRREIPHLVDLQEEIEPRDATVIGLAVDSGTPEEVMSFAGEFGVDYPIWLSNTTDVVRHFQAPGFPTTLLIDREGIIRKKYIGPRTKEALLADLEPLL